VRPTVEEPTENVQPKEHTTTTPSLSELATAYGRATIEHAYARERRENIERDPSASDEQIAEAIAEESRASTTDRDAFNVLTAVPQAPAATLASYAAQLDEIGRELGRALDGINSHNDESGEFDGGSEFESQDEANDALWERLSDDVDTVERIGAGLGELAVTLAA